MEELDIKNKSQIETRWRWYRNGEKNRFIQPVEKQYSYGKVSEELSTETQLQNEIFFKLHIDALKNYNELERMWN